MKRTYVYVDGESHFIRSECAWREIHGATATLDRLTYPGEDRGKLVLVVREAKVFWTRRMNPGVERVVYFSSVSGDEEFRHNTMVALRDFDVESAIIHEKRVHSKQRDNVLRNEHLIEKPKGVDIKLAVRMLTDAYNGAFDDCHLYTSDADFLPVIQAVRSLGKRVFVHGYSNGLSAQSELFYVPDKFFDLEESLRDDCELDQSNDQ